MDPTFKVAISRHALTRKIPPGDAFWPIFNGSFVNREVTQMDLADAIYTGHPLTTWHRHNWRNAKNYQLGQHLGLDFDAGDEHSTLAALSQDKFIAKHAALLYTTPSHTPDMPKGRAVFLLDTPIHQAANYALATQALLWLFGTADRQCRDACRFWYGSAGCEMEYFEQVLSLETVKHLIAQYQASGQRERRRQTQTWPTRTDQAEVTAALQKIPPWQIEYDDWVAVLMALQREYGPAGLGLAETWADGSDGEVQRKWKSFSADGNPTGVVTLGTVFALAQRFGWRGELTA